MAEPLILRSDDGAVATLTLNAPERLNALSFAMLDALDQALDGVEDAVRVVILQGGPRAFSVGHDLREIQAYRADPDGGAAATAALFDRCARVMQKLAALPQPVIAEVRGVATAGGCQLAASCDLIVAAETARFGVNGINIGLFCSTPMVALTRKIAPSAALEYLLTGELIPAPRAVELGLVTRMVPEADLTAATLALARQIATKLPVAVRHGKQAFRAIQGLPLDEAYRAAGPIMCANILEPDTAEGIQAFLEKRKPVWAV
jgi:enoyl-CoA hydratase/carnithine racemase